MKERIFEFIMKQGYGHTKFVNPSAIVVCNAEYYKEYGYGIKINYEYFIPIIFPEDINTSNTHQENIDIINEYIRNMFE